MIDFSVNVGDGPIIAERGKTIEVPIRIEAPNASEKMLTIRVAPERGNIDLNQLDMALSATSATLSENDIVEGRVTDIGNGRGLRDVATLRMEPSASLEPGIYSFGIEVVEEVNTELADGLVAGTLVIVQVK